MPINLANYYDRFDDASGYERHLFRAGNVLQSAELNEIQSASMFRLRQITDSLLKEGDVLSGAEIVVDLDTGTTDIAGGAIYLRGAVRGVPHGHIVVPTTGLINVGVYLTETVVTELQDPDLRDPAVSFRNYQDPGAARLHIGSAWGYEGDGQTGDFYSVYQVEEGLVISKAPPPQVDATSQAIARYDRQSVGGYYVSQGLLVTRLADTPEGEQVYSMAAGVARVGGEEILRDHARRGVYAAVPTTRLVNNETHAAQGGTEQVVVDFPPIHAVSEVSVVRQETVAVTHGLPGALDAIYGPGNVLRTSIVTIVSVTMGEAPSVVTYTAGTDYQLTASKVDWSLPAPGIEPSPGETYSVTYTYRDTYVPETWDYTGLTVTGAVAGTEILLTYDWALPRYDLVCLDVTGQIRLVTGIAAPLRPRVPPVPASMLGIAVIEQRWDASTRVINNAPRMVPMNELNAIGRRVDTLFALMAEERLARDLTQRDVVAKKGVFADPFLDDDLRDEGLTQTAAIVSGELTLGLDIAVFDQTLLNPEVLTATGQTTAVGQLLRTSSMLINGYTFALVPMAQVVLTPPHDFWIQRITTYTSAVTQVFIDFTTLPDDSTFLPVLPRLLANEDADSRVTNGQLLVSQPPPGNWQERSSSTVEAESLRPIEVRFDLTGYSAGEILETVTFAGRSVAFGAI